MKAELDIVKVTVNDIVTTSDVNEETGEEEY